MMIDSEHLKKLLNIDKSVTIHHRNLQVLAAELYKVHNGLAPEFMNDIFKKRDVTYNFRNNLTLETRNINLLFMAQKQFILSWSMNMETFAN